MNKYDIENKSVIKKADITNKNHFTKYFIMYTIFFVVIFLFGFKDFLFHYDKSFIWHLDGVKQHFPFLLDLSEIIKGQYLKGDFQFWSWDIGLGADIIQSYSYYNIGDPISILTALVFSRENLELGYSIMVVLRIFLVGLSLMYYLKYMNIKLVPGVISGLMYAFSTQVIFWGIRHPFFTNAAIILPLLFLGIEKIYKGKKGNIFIICIALSAVSNFYFFYMNTIAIFIYAVVRFFYYVEEDRLRTFFKLFFKVCAYYIIGMGIGAVLFIPSVYGFLNTARTSSDLPDKLLFPLKTYKDLLAQLIGLNYNNGYRITVAGVVLPCIPLFFMLKNKKVKSFKLLFLIHTIFLCLPIMYSVFNGFSSPNNRWLYIYVLYLCIIVAFTINQKDKIEVKDLMYTILFILIYFVVLRGHFDLGEIRTVVIPILSIIIFVISTIFYKMFIRHTKSQSKSTRFLQKHVLNITILFLVSLNIIGNTSVLMLQDNYGGKFAGYDTVYDRYDKDKTSIDINDDSFYRVDYDDDQRNNKSVVNNFRGTQLYNSIIDKDIMEFYKFNNLRTRWTLLSYMGVDNISPLDELLGVKYYISEDENSFKVPYGYNLMDDKRDAYIYKNDNYLPIGFVYDNYILKDDLDDTSNISRIYNMLDAVIVDDKIKDIGEIKPTVYEKKLDYQTIQSHGIEINDNKIIAKKNKAKIIFKINNVHEKEIYMRLNRIYYEDPLQDFKVTVKIDNTSKSIKTRKESDTYYEDNRDYFYNLGYCKDEELIVTVSFSNEGEYSFEDLDFYGVDMRYYDNKINKLKKNSLTISEYDNNYINGNINMDKRGVLFLSIPYTEAWKIDVNGERIKTFKANNGFTAIVLDKGYNEINLKYITPYLVPSVLISIISIGIFIYYVIRNKRKPGSFL